jgi:membrane-associated phospholipid phosphatase
MKMMRGLLCSCTIFSAAFVGMPTSALAQTTLTLPAGTQTAASAPASQSVPSLSQLFTSAVTDVTKLPTRATFLWIGVGAAATLVAHTGDAAVTGSFTGSRRMQETFESGSTIGGMQVQLGSALATYAIGRATGSPRVALVGADLFRAQVLSQIMTQTIKFAAQRTRPDGTSLSFPSGHTSATFASATVLQRHFGWKAGVPAYALATYVATSRIEEHRHYLSDVAFGAVLGIVAGRTVTVGRGDARFAVAPVATSGGGAVNFTWVGPK